MAAPTGYPSWVYNQTQNLSQIVQNVAAFNALPGPGTWTTTPFVPSTGGTAPSDPGFPDTDTRLQQVLIEGRISNLILANAMLTPPDDLTALRAEVLANDSSLTS